ncbi:MAG: hypothetical protein J6Y37_01065 [Paludibacteraceae bacterium]|nr:hypothetical protein [Paludibacteraceae bacterium]
MTKRLLSLLPLLMTSFCCSAQTVSGKVAGHDYVDLGLPSGIKWATCNVGADKPTKYGEIFAWGETSPKTEKKYNWRDYKWVKDLNPSFTKYVTSSTFGSVDNKSTLEAEDDAASVNWGKTWRTPTIAELRELKEGCEWSWTKDFNGSGVAGEIGTSKSNGKTIFLPAAGYMTFSEGHDDVGGGGYYWSSSLYEDQSYQAYRFDFRDNFFLDEEAMRYHGRSIRAVTK